MSSVLFSHHHVVCIARVTADVEGDVARAISEADASYGLFSKLSAVVQNVGRQATQFTFTLSRYEDSWFVVSSPQEDEACQKIAHAAATLIPDVLLLMQPDKTLIEFSVAMIQEVLSSESSSALPATPPVETPE